VDQFAEDDTTPDRERHWRGEHLFDTLTEVTTGIDVTTTTPSTATVLAHERRLPVLAPLQPLFADSGLVRGRLLATSGPAAVSLALALGAGATQAGSWLGVLGMPELGVVAAAEVGVAPERMVFVASPSGRGTSWAEVLAALADGFDLVLVPATARLGPSDARRVQARLPSRGGVVIVVGGPGPFRADVHLDTQIARHDQIAGWHGLDGDGAGWLRCRTVQVTAGGRRGGRPRQVELWLPGPQGVVMAAPTAQAERADDSEHLGPPGPRWSRTG
jgi:hypothetical protein